MSSAKAIMAQTSSLWGERASRLLVEPRSQDSLAPCRHNVCAPPSFVFFIRPTYSIDFIGAVFQDAVALETRDSSTALGMTTSDAPKPRRQLGLFDAIMIV